MNIFWFNDGLHRILGQLHAMLCVPCKILINLILLIYILKHAKIHKLASTETLVIEILEISTQVAPMYTSYQPTSNQPSSSKLTARPQMTHEPLAPTHILMRNRSSEISWEVCFELAFRRVFPYHMYLQVLDLWWADTLPIPRQLHGYLGPRSPVQRRGLRFFISWFTHMSVEFLWKKLYLYLYPIWPLLCLRDNYLYTINQSIIDEKWSGYRVTSTCNQAHDHRYLDDPSATTRYRLKNPRVWTHSSPTHPSAIN